MIRITYFVVLILLFAVPPSLAQSIPTVKYQDHIHISSAHDLVMMGGMPKDVAANDRCVVGLDGAGLWILSGEEDEISDTPLFFPVGVSSSSIELEGDLAFVGGWPSLTIVDLLDLSSPSVVGATPGLSAYKFDLDGDFVYMSGSAQGMHVVDISDIQNPRNVATLPTAAEVEDVAVADGYAYLAEREVGIRIVDISEPTAPVAVALVPRIEWTYELDMHQGSLYVGGGGEFACYDVPAPGSLVLRWALPVDASIRDMDLVGEMAYLASVETAIMLAVRIAGPGLPVVENDYPRVTYDANRIVTRNDHAYLATNWWEFLTLNNLLSPAVPPLDTVATPLGNIEAVDDLIFGRSYAGLECYQVDATGQMNLVGTYDHATNYRSRELAIQNTTTNRYMWAADNGRVFLFDITDPAAMSYVLSLNESSTPLDLEVGGSFLAVLDGRDLVRIYNVADPLNPNQILVWPGTITADHMEVRDGRLHLAGDSTYQVNWTAGQQFFSATATLPGTATNLIVSQESVLVGLERGLVLIDISDITAPFIVDELTFPDRIKELDVRDGWGYAALDNGTSVFSYDNHAGLMMVGSCETGDGQRGISLGSDCAFVLGGGSLLTIPLQTPLPVNCNGNDVFDMLEIAGHPSLDWNNDGIIDNCQQGQGLSDVPFDLTQKYILNDAFPNPFNPQTTIAFELPNEQAVRLSVYDVSGRLVDVLIDNEIAVQGRNEIVWRGRDMAGRVVSAGVYFYRLDAGSYSETKRMVLVK